MTEGTRSVADILKEAREGEGRSISDIASELNIRLCYLEALESGRFEALPPPAFSAGFVRSYGILLKLDGSALARDFKCEAGGDCDRAELNFPEPVTESRVPGRAVLLTGGAALLAVYFGWVANFGSTTTPDMMVSAVPDRLVGLSAGDANTATDTYKTSHNQAATMLNAPEPDDTGAALADVSSPVSVSTDQQSMIKAVGTDPDDSETASPNPGDHSAQAESASGIAEPVPSVAETASHSPAVSPRVLIRAKTDTWFYVVDAMDREVWNGVLRAGENWVPRAGATGLRLMTSNAGALHVLVDGVDIGALGNGGDVVRDVLLTPDGLKKRETLAMR